MNKEQLSEYRQWQQKVIEIAVMDYMYALAVIKPLVDGHTFQKYFENGDSPHEAIIKYRGNND